MRKVSLFFMPFWMFVSCGQQESSDLLNERTNKSIVIAGFGGNGSCYEQEDSYVPAGEVNRKVADIAATVKQNFETTVKLISGCFISGNPQTVMYTSSDKPNQVMKTDTHQLSSVIKGLVPTDSRLFLVGHSYGGWASMRIAKELAGAIRHMYLVSIDPISPLYCTFGNPFGCTDAPKDFSHADRTMLNTATVSWVNFYQTKTIYLHSEEMEEADANIKLSLSHRQIDGATEVWSRFYGMIETYLSTP